MTPQPAGLSRIGASLSGWILDGDRAMIVLALAISFRAPDLLWNQFGLRAVGVALAGVILLALLLRGVALRRWPDGWKMPMALVSAYLLACVICTTQAQDAQLAKAMLIDVAKGATILFLVTSLCRSMRSLNRVIAAMLFAGCVMGTISVLQQWTGTFDQSFGPFGQVDHKLFPQGFKIYRSTSVIGDPNYYAQVLIILIPLAVVGLWRVRRPIAIAILFWTGLACVLAVMCTYSRGGLLTMLAVLVMLGVLALKYRPRRSSAALTCALLVAAVLLMPSHYATRMSTFGSFLPKDGQWQPKEQLSNEIGFRGRLSAALVGLEMFKDHPLLGVGPGNFRTHYQTYSHKLQIDPSNNIVRYAHSHYLAVAAETGLLGLTAFMTLLVVVCRRMHHAQKKLKHAGLPDPAMVVAAISVGIYGFLISSMFLDTGFIYHLWLLTGIAFALPRIAEHEIQRRETESRPGVGAG